MAGAKGLGTDSEHIVVGKIAKAQGLCGELKIIPFSGNPVDLFSFQKIFLDRTLDRSPYIVENWRAHGKFAVVKVCEISDRDGAEAQVGAEVLVQTSQMPPLAPDEFYWHEVVGLRVVTDQGQELGEVTSLIATGAKDVMVVTGNGREYLIPVLQEIIVRQDKEAGILVIAPMDGLLDMNLPDAI